MRQLPCATSRLARLADDSGGGLCSHGAARFMPSVGGMNIDRGEHRGMICELCGQKAAPIPYTGKRRRPHGCSHGKQCVRGQRLNGTHANHALCKQCLAHGRYA